MSRLVPIFCLIASPLLGVGISTMVAWQVYPQRELPKGVSAAESRKVINDMFEDASHRGRYIAWGGITGATLGVFGAVGIYVAGGAKRDALRGYLGDAVQRLPHPLRGLVGETPTTVVEPTEA